MLVHSELFEGAGDSHVRFGVGRADFANCLGHFDEVLDYILAEHYAVW